METTTNLNGPAPSARANADDVEKRDQAESTSAVAASSPAEHDRGVTGAPTNQDEAWWDTEAAPTDDDAALTDQVDLSALASIPDIVIRRLPVYVRTLRRLSAAGTASVSSDELAGHIGVTAAQIRRDLSYFGKFGKQGKGYDTAFLAESIAKILGLNQDWDVALAGLGNLGRAIVRYRGFARSSFNIVALFDYSADGPSEEIEGLPLQAIERMEGVIREHGIQIGIVAVPASTAQEVADRMVAGGVRAILNYAPVVLKVPKHVTVREIDPVSALQSMTYYLSDANT